MIHHYKIEDYPLIHALFLLIFTVTHVYILYEGYGYSPSSLYALGFFSGAVFSPFTGAFIDKIGRKKAALLYCILEILINSIEQIPNFNGLVVGRILGGLTTNIYCSVFESYLITEVEKRGFSEEELEQVLCDSNIVANSSAILSGLLAHYLAAHYGAEGPFQGAVCITVLALLLISLNWSENFGTLKDLKSHQSNSIWTYLKSALESIKADSSIARIGMIQGLVEGTLETFLFLWSPALAIYAASAPIGTIGLDYAGEPAYGLIFGVFMLFAVTGSFLAPMARKGLAKITTSKEIINSTVDDADDRIDPFPVNILCTSIYFASALLFLIPILTKEDSPAGFSICLISFILFQFLVGSYEPLEGIVRSIYIPSGQVCSIVNVLRVLTNIFIATGVYLTTHVSLAISFGCLSATMIFAAILQFTLIPRSELTIFVQKMKLRSYNFRFSTEHAIIIIAISLVKFGPFEVFTATQQNQ
jgi:MFS family permease